MGPRKVLFALDESQHSRAAVDAAFSTYCCLLSDEIHLVAVIPPIADAVVGPIGSAAVVYLSSMKHAQQQMVMEEAKAKTMLELACDLIIQDYKIPSQQVHTHVLPTDGGASGVSGTLLAAAKREGVDMIVTGSRGMGGGKSSLMSLVGLGSVGDALVKNCPCPVLLVREDPSRKRHVQGGKRVCVAYDASPAADKALCWAIQNVLQPTDQLHILYVLDLPSPFPLLLEPVAALYRNEDRVQADAQVVTDAGIAVAAAVAAAVAQGVSPANITSVVLKNSNAGKEVAAYSDSHDIDVVVCGSRGMGAVKRALDSLVGLGSISMHLAHSLHGILAVVR